MPNPCYDAVNHKDCPRRRAGCAVDCPDWREYVEQRNIDYVRRNLDSDTNSYIIDNVEKRKKMTHVWGGKVE